MSNESESAHGDDKLFSMMEGKSERRGNTRDDRSYVPRWGHERKRMGGDVGGTRQG